MDELTNLREKINIIDELLVPLIAKRMEICLEVANYKKNNQIPVMQSNRVNEVKKRCCEIGNEHGLEESFVDSIYNLIIREACRLENQIIGD